MRRAFRLRSEEYDGGGGGEEGHVWIKVGGVIGGGGGGGVWFWWGGGGVGLLFWGGLLWGFCCLVGFGLGGEVFLCNFCLERIFKYVKGEKCLVWMIKEENVLLWKS